MHVNQKPLNQIEICWYHFTPRKFLSLMVSVNFVRFVPHWLCILSPPPFFEGGGAPCINRVSRKTNGRIFSTYFHFLNTACLGFGHRIKHLILKRMITINSWAPSPITANVFVAVCSPFIVAKSGPTGAEHVARSQLDRYVIFLI